MHKEGRIWLLELKVRKNLALTTNTLILPILGTSAQKEVPSDLTREPNLTPLTTNPCSSPLRELHNVQLFRELLGSSPNFSSWNFPVLTTGFVCFRRVPPPPSTFIQQENSSQQLLLSKKEVSASSEVARHEYLYCEFGSKRNTCPARKEAPDLPAQESYTNATSNKYLQEPAMYIYRPITRKN